MWHWHKSTSKNQEAIWHERLGQLPGAVFSELFGTERLSLDVYAETEEEVLLLQACYGGRVTPLPAVDWVAATAPEKTPPLLIRNRLVLTASDSPETLAELRGRYPERIVLSFPAERAFGTGNHATTSTCLRMLCDEVKGRRAGSWTLIDVGCGTGVLALAGMRLGAARAISFDFDPVAVEVARRNIERNGGAEGLRLFQSDVFAWEAAPGEEADIVLANLFSTVLQKAFPRLRRAMKREGVLVISGILDTQAAETLEAARAEGLRTLRIVSRGKWTTAKLARA